jgi:hypothetical protein
LALSTSSFIQGGRMAAPYRLIDKALCDNAHIFASYGLSHSAQP